MTADHPGQPAAAGEPTTPADRDTALAMLSRGKYLSLTTFRKTGGAVPTPVWFAEDDGKLLLWTGAESGKVKRLRHTSRVTVAPCDARGRLRGDAVDGHGRIMAADETPRLLTAMRRRYALSFRVTSALTRLGRALGLARARAGQVGVEITLR